MTSSNQAGPKLQVTVLDYDEDPLGRPSELINLRWLEMSFEDSDKMADKLTLTLDNRDLAFFEQEGEDILGGTLLEVAWGYQGNLSPPRRAIVKRITGGETLKVEALDSSFELHRSTKAREWEGVKRSDVVNEVAGEYGFAGALLQVEDTVETYETISQVGETDAAFLTRLARAEGFRFFIDDTGLHWHSRRFGEVPRRVLEWRGNTEGAARIIGWSVDSNLARRVGRVTVKGRDVEKKQDIEATATADTVDRATLGAVISVVDPETLNEDPKTLERSATEVTRPTSASTAERIGREAAARFRIAERESIKLSVTLEGDPKLRAKMIVDVRGLTAMFDGLYFVDRAVHKLGGQGYRVTLKLVRDGLNAEAVPNSTKEQGGSRNQQEPDGTGEGGTVEEIVTVDPETLEERTTYRRRT